MSNVDDSKEKSFPFLKIILKKIVYVILAVILSTSAGVAYSHYFVKLMSNKQNRLTFVCQALHNFHKLVYFLWDKNVGGLVEDKNFVVAVKHFKNFHSLLHTNGNVFN